MPYPTLQSLPDYIRKKPKKQQEIWRGAFNAAYKQYKSEERAFKIANSALKKWVAKHGSAKGEETIAEQLTRLLGED